MLIKITRSCHNGCIHCCNDNKPCNEHMSLETFKEALLFAEKYDKNNIVGNEIAGGEPTEHPLFFQFLDTYFEVLGKNKLLTVATNGHYLLEHHEIIHEYLEKYPTLSFQITYDNRYYPKKLDITKRALRHKRIIIVTEIGKMYPQGRAVTNKLKVSDNIMCPPCFNLKLIMMQMKVNKLEDIFTTMRKMEKYCSPSIQFDGSIAFGEYDSCPKYCSIYDDEKTIINAISAFDCNGCPEAIKICEQKFLTGELKVRGVK